ncbi:MAG: S-adenosylmethionine decarboxylase [Blastocatellia bacterium AA13]|nr:MAG: S-adenosylmethionine decarboxylase [Blastocatellia bacterium AA13]
MTVGTEWMIDAEGCKPDLLRDPNVVRGLCEQVIDDLSLRVVSPELWHEFPPPGGVTGLFLLTESHLACHTYPEDGVATFNLYCCRSRPEWNWAEQLTRLLGAQRVSVRSEIRGSASTYSQVGDAVGGRGGIER